MPGRDGHEAVQNYRAPIANAIRCLAADAYLVPGKNSYNYSLGAAGYWRLGHDENGIKLKSAAADGEELRFYAEQAYRIVACDPEKHDPELGAVRVTTTMYAYELTANGAMLWQMHWHPKGDSDEYRPHLHLPGRDHLPDGRHTIEDAVEWCIGFGAEPATDDWRSRLAESKGIHELHRTWSMVPPPDS